MTKCVDCGEPIAAWEDYCRRCGARKVMTATGDKQPPRKKWGAGIFGRLKKSV